MTNQPDLLPAYQIIALSIYPDRLDQLVDQQWQVWGYDDRQDLKDFFVQEFSQSMPRTWLLIDTTKPVNNDLIGAVTLSMDEMGDCQPNERNPWLGYLYVDPNYRGQGLAKHLTNYAVEQAYQLGYITTYLYASDETARYQKWGWQILQTLEFQDEIVNVMQSPKTI